MPWRPLPRIAVAVAIHPFTASLPSDLPLELGDDLYIIEQGGKNGAWYRGYLVAPPSLLAGLTTRRGKTLEARVFSGIFPRCCVDVREHLGDAAPDSKPHNFQDGETTLQRDAAVGDSPMRGGPDIRKSIAHRKASELNMKKEDGMEGDTETDGSKLRWPGGLPSQGSTEQTNGTLTRSLSHRSLKSSQFNQPPDMSSYPIDLPSESPGKRPQAPVPMLKIGDETPTSTSEPLVDEIASSLREWHSRNLHEFLLARNYTLLEKLSNLVKRLDLARRQLLYGVLTAQELIKLREDVVWDLVSGNKMLNDEVIVRDPKQQGRLLTCEDSAFDLATLQSNMSLLERPPITHQEPLALSHLMAELTGFGANGLLLPSMSFQLYVRHQGEKAKQLTESFAIELPSPDIFENVEHVRKMRTLFPDLTQTDTGDPSQPPVDLFLVVRVQAGFPAQATFQDNRKAQRQREEDRERPLTSGTAGPASKGGRQSLMWAQKAQRSFGSVRNRSIPDGRAQTPVPGEKNLGPIDENTRPVTRESVRPANEKSQPIVRRYVGIGALNLKDTIHRKTIVEQPLTIWTPSEATEEKSEAEQARWDEVLRELMTCKSGNYIRAKSVELVQLRLRSFRHPNLDELIVDTPTLLQDITITPKAEFGGVPTRARSDIYITINEAHLPNHALLSHPERGTVSMAHSSAMDNVQVTLEVRKSNGQRIDSAIIPFSDSHAVKAWRSPAVARGEAWRQMIKLKIAPEDVADAHVIMSLADAPGFPFALCYMPLWSDGAFIKDGAHFPLLYLYDKTTSDTVQGRGAYLDFPWSSRSPLGDLKDEALTGPVATMKLETSLCSTFFSQDRSLLGVLNWRSQSKVQTIGLVKKISHVPEMEIVKLIDDVLDALFSILVNQSGEEEYENEVFSALVTTLGIVYDRRFNLGPHVDHYAETAFDHPYAAPCLIRAYTALLADHHDLKKARQVRAAFKVSRHILKFILVARHKQQEKENGIGTSTEGSFKRDIKIIFHSLEKLVRDPSPALIGNKTLVMQHMAAWITELKFAFSEEEILQIASSFVDACAEVTGKLILYKLVLVNKILESGVLVQDFIRARIITNTSKWIEPYWGSLESSNKQAWDQIRLCCSVVSAQSKLPGFDGSRYVEKVLRSYCYLLTIRKRQQMTFSQLFQVSHPFQSKSISSATDFDEALIELAALLTSLTSAPFADCSDMSVTETTALMDNVLDVITSIISGEAFPKTWLSLYVYHHKSMLQLLESILEVMTNRLLPVPEEADSFNTDLWHKYLKTVLLLLRSDTLALETFPEQKRRAVWKIAGDVRERGSVLLKKSWEVIGWDTEPEDLKKYGLQKLGGFQVQYVPGLVSPIVELCLSVHQGLRGVAVKIFQSMIISEWTLNEDLTMVQAEMIESLDNLYKTRDVANSLVQKMFINELLDAFEVVARMPLDPLWQSTRDMVSTADELLELLTAVHGDDSDESTRIMDTLMLMNFYKDMQKEDIFIRYVHHLAELQSNMHNKTEAGLALQLHADLYTWESTPVRALETPPFPEQSSFERKAALNFEMIKYFEEGAAWSNALASYRELAHQYESVYFDYAKLARTQRAMATIYQTIARGDWHPPRYFRVVHLGLGFPQNLQDRQFIYEGEPFERQSAFTDRLRQLYPTAQILVKGDPEDMEGQYLQVQPVNVHRDLEHPVYQKPKVSQSTREYITSSAPFRFSVTSKRHSPVSGVQDQWIEKTIYTAREGFPTILRRSEIVAIDTVQLTPLQTAVERTTRKTAELSALEKRVSTGDEGGISNLTEAIISSVDPSSVATVAQYRQLLPVKPEVEDDDEEILEEPMSSMQNALQIALLDHVSTLKHCLGQYTGPLHSGTFTSLSENLNHTFEPELMTLFPPSAAPELEPELHDVLSSPPSTSAGAPSTITSFPAANGISVSTPEGPLSPAPQALKSPSSTKNRLNFPNMKSPFASPSPTKADGPFFPPAAPFSAPSEPSSRGAASQSNATRSSGGSSRPLNPTSATHTNGFKGGIPHDSRPPTDHISRADSTTTKVKKRFSLLRMGSKLDRSGGPRPGAGMAAVGEE